MKVTWRLDGVPGLTTVLILADKVSKEEVGSHNRATAVTLQALERSRVRKVEGDLAAAIAVEGSGMNWRVGIEDKNVASRGGSSSHRNPSVYGIFVEYGTVVMDAKPFVRPSVDQVEPKHVSGLASVANRIEQRLRRG